MRCFGRLKYQKNGPLASETGKETSPPAPAGFSRRVRALWRVSLRSGFFRCRADFGPDGSRFFPSRFGRGRLRAVPAGTGLRRPAGKVRDGLLLSRTACGADCARGVCRPERKVRRGRLNVSRTGDGCVPYLAPSGIVLRTGGALPSVYPMQDRCRSMLRYPGKERGRRTGGAERRPGLRRVGRAPQGRDRPVAGGTCLGTDAVPVSGRRGGSVGWRLLNGGSVP